MSPDEKPHRIHRLYGYFIHSYIVKILEYKELATAVIIFTWLLILSTIHAEETMIVSMANKVLNEG